MVPVKVSVGKHQGATNHTLTNWFSNEAKLDQLAIGEISIEGDSSEVEIHLDKVESVIKVMANRDWNGDSVNLEISK
jgi:hypothetical protein